MGTLSVLCQLSVRVVKLLYTDSEIRENSIGSAICVYIEITIQNNTYDIGVINLFIII